VRERLLSDGPIFQVVDRGRFEPWLDADLTDNSFSKFMFSFVSAKLFLEGDLAQSSQARAA
jgi:asparagine synthase (glutamine-hydrolysing)